MAKTPMSVAGFKGGAAGKGKKKKRGNAQYYRDLQVRAAAARKANNVARKLAQPAETLAQAPKPISAAVSATKVAVVAPKVALVVALAKPERKPEPPAEVVEMVIEPEEGPPLEPPPYVPPPDAPEPPPGFTHRPHWQS